MTSVWRIVKERHADSAFSGDSSALYPGRWNNSGVKVIYLSGSLSLATLEILVHVQQDGAKIKFVCFRVDIPERIKIDRVEASHLPKNWRSCPAAESTRLLGSKWAKANDSVLLMVPSIIIPSEYNCLINPLHKYFSSLKISSPSPFLFDPRMWKK